MYLNSDDYIERKNESNDDSVVSIEEKRKKLAEHSRQLLEKQLKSFPGSMIKFKR